MKKKVLIIILIILVIILGIIILNESLIKYSKDGNYKGFLATTRKVSLTVLPSTPILSIISPEPATHSTTSILFTYTTYFEDLIWYNIDNTENITLTPPYDPIELTLTAGSHTLYLYANNTQGDSVENITFTIDLTPATQDPGDTSSPSGGDNRRTTPPTEPEINGSEPEPEEETPFKPDEIIDVIIDIPEKIITESKYNIPLIILIIIVILIILKRKEDENSKTKSKLKK